MDTMLDLVLFAIEGQRYAVPLSAVERVARAVEITPLPNSAPSILGVVNVRGRVVPVVDLRRRFGWPTRDVELSDEMLILHTAARRLALLVDEVLAVIAYDRAAMVAAAQVAPHLGSVQSLIKLPDGLVLVQDPEQLLADIPSCAETSAVAGEGAVP
jgi:purine-binding chemotaxis protein CheW